MKHSMLCRAAALVCLIALPTRALAQGSGDRGLVDSDDYRFAQSLMEAGYFDLAEVVFQQIITGAPSDDKRAEGEIGLARLKSSEAEITRNPKRKLALIEEANRMLADFVKKYPSHPRAMDVKSSMGELLQLKAEAYAAQARRDRSKLALCEQALNDAERMWRDIESDLKAKGEAKRSEKFMLVYYNLGLALWAYADVMKDFAEKQESIGPKLDTLITIYEEFGWNWSDYFYFYPVSETLGRAYKMKAQRAPREKSDAFWKSCFDNMSTWHSLAHKKWRAHPTARHLAARGCRAEMQVMLERADGLSGTLALNNYREAANLPEKTTIFKIFTGLEGEDMGKFIRMEQAKAYFRSGDQKNGEKILESLVRDEPPDSPWRFRVMSMRADLGGDLPASGLVEAGDAWSTRFRFLEAAQNYRKAIAKLESEGGRQIDTIAYCWFEIGQCYYQVGRYFEAEAAYGMLGHTRFSGVRDKDLQRNAMSRQLKTRKAVRHFTGDDSYSQWIDELKTIAMRIYPKMIGYDEIVKKAWNASTRGQELLRDARKARQPIPVVEAIKAFDEAIKSAGEVPRNLEEYEEVQFVKGLANYYAGTVHLKVRETKRLREQQDDELRKARKRFREGLAAFSGHTRHVETMATKDPEVRKRQLASLKFITRIAMDPNLDHAEDAMERALKDTTGAAQRFAGINAKDLMEVVSNRVEAHLKLFKDEDPTRLDAAEADLKELMAIFEQEKIYSKIAARALVMTANVLRNYSRKVRPDDEKLAQQLQDRSSDYFARATEIHDPSQFNDPDTLITYAVTLFDQASRTRDAKRFMQAYNLFEQALTAAKIDQGTQRTIRWRMALCLMKAGRLDEAIDEYKVINADDPKKIRIWAWEGMADLYRQKMDKQKRARGDGVKESGKIAADIYGQLAKQLYLGGKIEQDWWRLRYKYMSTLFEYDSDQLYQKLYRAMIRYPYWDDGEYKDEDGVKLQVKYNELVRKARKKYSKPLPESPPKKKPESPEDKKEP